MKIWFCQDGVEENGDRIVSHGMVIEPSPGAMRVPFNGGSVLLEGTVYRMLTGTGQRVALDSSEEAKRRIGQLFEDNGIDAVEMLEGHFVGIMLPVSGPCTVFSDVFGREELFYTSLNNGFIAATKLASVVESLKVVGPLEYDQDVLVGMLTLYGNYAPKKDTLYSGVKRLGVGDRIVVTEAGWHVQNSPFTLEAVEDYGQQELEEYYEIMRDAVEVRSSEHINWIFMSSGFDSSTLLGLLVSLHGAGKVRGVIGRMRYSERAGIINTFELERAAKIAEHYGVALDVVDLDYTGQECIDFFNTISPQLKDRHLYLNSAYNFYTLSNYIKKHACPEDAIFAGEISDGVHNFGFAQFATILEHPDIGFREYSDKMASYLFSPSFASRVFAGGGEDDFVYQALKARCSGAEFVDFPKLDETERKVRYLASFFHRPVRIPFYGKSNSKLVSKHGSTAFEERMCREYLLPVAEKLEPEVLYSAIIHLYNSYHWQGATPRNMCAGVDDLLGRTIAMPFWDERLHSFLAKMPESWGRGLDLKPTKYPLKWILENKLNFPMELQTGPHSYLYDVNPQFSHTSETLFASAFTEHFRSVLSKRAYRELLRPSHFNLDYIENLVDGFLAGQDCSGEDMGNLLSLCNLSSVGWY